MTTLEQRLACRQRPSRRAAMHQRWDDLLFLHWEIDPQAIQKSLPPGLFVDQYEGKAYIAIVPFKMRAIRPAGLPSVPYLSNFLECNVRTYVRNAAGIPGVWFYSLDTDRWIAHWIAKKFFHLPYVWSRMTEQASGMNYHYSIKRRDESEPAIYSFEADSELGVAEPSSLEFFLLERYLLYSHSPKTNQLFQGQVHHSPYQFSRIQLAAWDVAPIGWNHLPIPEGKPIHACYSPGVQVEIFPIEKTS